MDSNQHPGDAKTGETRAKSIDEALRVLDEALATGHSDLKGLVTEEYENLKGALADFAPGVTEALKGASSEMYERVSGFTQDFAQKGVERSREMASNVDQRVRANPWPIIGGVAIGTFALGYLLGARGAVLESESDLKNRGTNTADSAD